MTARTCQLCGKPLSRLRVGGDGDFCSREHRNQHRLRCGMDRLEEANKVTSLMRRRENPRHISAARLMCNSALERRGFFEAKQSCRQDGHGELFAGPACSGLASRRQRSRPVCRRQGCTPESNRIVPSAGPVPHPYQRPRHAAAGSASPSETAAYRFPRRRSFRCAATRLRLTPRRAISGCCARAKFGFTSARAMAPGCAWSTSCADAGEPGPSA